MAEPKPYSSTERDEAQRMRAAAERTAQLQDVPRPVQAAITHVLYAAATELDNGRPLAIEVRRAARHLLQAITRETADPR